MTTDSPAVPRPAFWSEISKQPWLPFLAGLLIITAASLVSLGQQTWSTELGAHGPIVLATGLWLLHYEGLSTAKPGNAVTWTRLLPLLAVAFVSYVFGRAYDFISIEVLAVYLTFVALLLRIYGFAQVRRWIFPLFYLAFVIPIPGWIIDRMTAPLQILVSTQAANLTAMLGYPVSRQGVVLEVAQYELFVEQACAGMNSLVGLTAVSLFYIYMMRQASWRYALLLVALILPIAVLVNIIRVLVLILITYHYGNEAAQGFLHGTTGMVLFGLALMMIFGIDMILARFLDRPAQ